MDKLIARVKVGESGQIVIPKMMRESMGILPREEIGLSMGEGGILIRKRKKSLEEHCKKILGEYGLKKGEKILMGDELYEQVFSEKYGLR